VDYQLHVTDVIDIAGYPVIGRNICVGPKTAPKQGRATLSVSPMGWFIGRKTYIVEAASAPIVSMAALSESLPATKAVAIPISTKDTVYTYELVAETHRVGCRSLDRVLSCDLAQMALTQGQTYTFSIERHFQNHHETVAQKAVKLLDAVKVEKTSVQEGQTVYDKPNSFTIETDKPLERAKVSLERGEGEASTDEPIALSIQSNVITVTTDKELARATVYRLKLEEATATDGSMTSGVQTVTFTLSGGPKVVGTNIGTSGVENGATVVLKLDQTVQDDQNITQFVRVSGAGAADITRSGASISLRLNAMPRCTSFTITVDKGLASQYGIASTESWQYTSRTRCSTVGMIGTSVEGRSINAYYFGTGSSTVLFTGAIHGSELSSKTTMEGLIAYMEEHATEIPTDRQVVVVPVVNPDGAAKATRYNAHGINLNRNFATTNWVSDTPIANGVEAGAGGSSPLSEPETAALAALTERLSPRFVVTYHSQGALVNSNDVGIAASLGPRYATLAGYKFVASSDTTEAFGFEMTGTYEDWLAERGTPAILIELPTHTGNYFSRQLNAIWAMIRG
jgi:protein MpaA